MDKMDLNEQKMTDQGWRDMKMRLDRELPVAGNSRRPVAGWFWFSMVFAGLLAMGGWLFFSKNEPRIQPVSPIENSRPVAGSSDQPVEALSAQVVENSNNPTPGPSPEGKREATPPVILSFPRGRGLPEAGTQAQKAPESPPTDRSAGLKNPFSEKTAANFSEKTEVAGEPLATIRPIEPAAKPEIKNLKPAFFELNPIDEKQLLSNLLPGSKRPTGVSKTTIPFKLKAARSLRAGAFVELQTIDFQRLNGFSAGVVAEKRWHEGRRRLSVGLGWNRLVHSDYPNPVTDNAAEFEHSYYVNQTEDSLLLFAETIADPSTTPANGYGSVVIAANVYNRLAMPVSVSQKLGVRWHVGLGLTPSWLFSAQSQFGEAALFKVFNRNKNAASDSSTTGTFIVADGYSLESVNSLLDRSLPRFDLAATAYVQVDLTRKWRLGLSFQHGLVNQTALPKVKKFHRSTNLQLVRWF